MLPDKNQLDDELILQIGGGSSDLPELYGPVYHKGNGISDILAVGLGNEDTYERTNELCRNCEPEPLKTSIPAGEVKTTVPDLSNKDRLVKIH